MGGLLGILIPFGSGLTEKEVHEMLDDQCAMLLQIMATQSGASDRAQKKRKNPIADRLVSLKSTSEKAHTFLANERCGRSMYPYGLIGNCSSSALIHLSGSIDWLCWPRPDSPPLFGKLLDPGGGSFSIGSAARNKSFQNYIPNTNILITTVYADDGIFKITDFCPRFERAGSLYRPLALFRIVERMEGNPSISVSCRPINGWEKETIQPARGSGHLQFKMGGDSIFLSTNMSLTYLFDEIPFNLSEPLYFGLTMGIPIDNEIGKTAKDFLQQTERYWRKWVSHCAIPSEFQAETIRSALTLKLHCYEDTGAILAALTTSLPEEPGKGRNWDYRFCWLRDSYFVLSAFHNLGHFEEIEDFIKFLLNVAQSGDSLRPVYRVDRSLPLPETEHANWNGFMNEAPVRSNNQAAEHVQNDVYGEMILTLAPIFFDERFQHLRIDEHKELLFRLGNLCDQSISQADAGLWELRKGWQEHSFSNLMCWAGLERVERILKKLDMPEMADKISTSKGRAYEALKNAIVDGSLRNGPTDPSFDAALLQLPILNFPDREVSIKTVREIGAALKHGEHDPGRSFFFRYLRHDDFGTPAAAFVSCSFWYAQALAKLGFKGEAREVMQGILASANHLGLFSEHFHPATRQQLGNFPQAFSHVGLINAAFTISQPWHEIL